VTSYVCQAFAIPPAITDGSIARFDVILPTGASANFPTEFAVYGCPNAAAYVANFRTAGVCPSSPSWGYAASGCTVLAFVYERGVLSYEFPPGIGLRVGNVAPYAFANLVIEIHYNNGAALANIVDNTAVKVTYITTPRAHDAAAFILGDPLYTFQTPVPANTALTSYETDCPSVCTQKFPAAITVFGDMLHMRNDGTSMFTTQFRNNNFLAITARTDFFHGGNHMVQPVNYVIQPGDRLNTHCSYQTNGNGDQVAKTNYTVFGLASTQEACWEVLYYYPITIIPATNTPIMMCGHHFANAADITVCGDGNFALSNLANVANPDVVDPIANHPMAFGVNLPQTTCPLPLPPTKSSVVVAMNVVLCVIALIALML